MQRRAAAVYAVFFLVIGAASYSLIATAEQPSLSFENPDHELSEGQSFTVDGQEYTVTAIDASMEGGGHGGSASLVRSGTVAWVNDSSRYTATLENGSNLTYDGNQWTVLTQTDAQDPSEFTLRGVQDRQAILQNDPNADNETVMHNGEEHVVIRENGTSRLQPAAEYFPEPETRQLSEGQTIQVQGNETTIETVTNESATLAWTAPRENTADLTDEGNVTLGDTKYLAHFPNNETVVLTSDFQSYDRQVEEMETFTTQTNGLWGVSILSILTFIFLLGMAYLPSRY